MLLPPRLFVLGESLTSGSALPRKDGESPGKKRQALHRRGDARASGPYRLIRPPTTMPMPNATSRLMKGRSWICCSRAAAPLRPRRPASSEAWSQASLAARPTAAPVRRPGS
jgi:hypothetical protein